MINIVLVGAGHIGSRHLQALSKLDNEKFNLFVVDTSTESLAIAKQHFEEVATTRFNIYYSTAISELPENISVAIIATSSMVRKKVTEELLKNKNVGFILFEKFLFPSIDEYYQVSQLLKKSNSIAFVNCPRRMWNVYKYVKEIIKGQVEFCTIGNNWGLGSNGLHLLDLFSFLVSDEDIFVNGDSLDKAIKDSKRAGYIEFTGTITATTKAGSRFSITSYNEHFSPATMYISCPTARITVREEGAKATVLISTLENNWKWEEKVFDIQFQSSLSNLVVDELLENESCELTPYDISSKLHISMLSVFLNLMNNILGKTTKQCLIT